MSEQQGNTEINLEELYQTYTSDQQIKDSFERRTVPTGKYVFSAMRASARLANEKSPFPGRKMGSFFGSLKDHEGKRRGSVGFDASWEVLKKPNGKMDGPSVLWGQLVTALGMKGSNVAEVITAAGQYPLNVYVAEAFRTPQGWVTARTPEERAELRQKNYEARNFVNSVSKAS